MPRARPCPGPRSARRWTATSATTPACAATSSTTRGRCASTWWFSSTARRSTTAPPCPTPSATTTRSSYSRHFQEDDMSDAVLAGTRKGLFRIEKEAGGRWRVARDWFLGDPVSMVLAEPGGRVHAACDLGHFGVKLKRSIDGGDTYTDIEPPAYPEKPEDAEDKDPMRGLEVPWTTKLIWSLEAGGDNELWCGTIPGGLFHSAD